MSLERTAVVIGSGVIGTSCAYYLMRSGWKVTLIDRGEFAQGSSHANCGFVCPSHVLPLAEPGMIGKALKSLLERNSPFAIKPRLDPSLWSWLLHFARRCNERDMIEAGRGIQPLLLSSLELYRDLVDRESLDCEFTSRGMLFAYKSERELESFAATDRLMREVFHAPAKRLDGSEMVALEPALKPGLAGGWYHEHDAHLRPDKLMKAWRHVLETGGVEIRANCAFHGFNSLAKVPDSPAVTALTDHGDLAANIFIVATGAWTPLLNRSLRCRIPIQPGKGYSLTMARPAVCPEIPLIFPETARGGHAVSIRISAGLNDGVRRLR